MSPDSGVYRERAAIRISSAARTTRRFRVCSSCGSNPDCSISTSNTCSTTFAATSRRPVRISNCWSGIFHPRRMSTSRAHACSLPFNGNSLCTAQSCGWSMRAPRCATSSAPRWDTRSARSRGASPSTTSCARKGSRPRNLRHRELHCGGRVRGPAAGPTIAACCPRCSQPHRPPRRQWPRPSIRCPRRWPRCPHRPRRRWPRLDDAYHLGRSKAVRRRHRTYASTVNAATTK